MAAAFLVIFLALSVIFLPPANAQAALGCGPANTKFDVTMKYPAAPAPTPTAGKALVVFIQDDYQFGAIGRPTTRFGIDGTWMGATHANSYFYVSIDPGEHHVCASWQSRESERSTGVLHFSAAAGKSYYFRARDVARVAPELVLSRLDSDEAKLILQPFSLSSSHPKK